MQSVHVVPDKADYCITSKIPEHFDGIGTQQAIKLVAEMYVHPDFSDGVAKPTQKTTVVKKDRFWEFLKWKDEVKLR